MMRNLWTYELRIVELVLETTSHHKLRQRSRKQLFDQRLNVNDAFTVTPKESGSDAKCLTQSLHSVV